MTAERWQRVMAIFRGAVESDPSARAGFLKQNCGDDEELQKEVEALLASNQDPGPLPDPPIPGAPATSAPSPKEEMNPGASATLVVNDRYEVERELGRGGMSVVYLARDRQLLARRVVVKVLLEETSHDPWIRQKFLQEMEALSRIDHPGVVGVLDTGLTAEGQRFLVMQYIEGVTLRRAIEPGGMSFARAAGLIRQIGQALAAAHEKGVWHRDLKPENIMLQSLGGEDHVKLIDFGIAGIQNSQFTGEKTEVAGSLSYMAPEQFSGRPCAASDTYALGILAYEILMGSRPGDPNDAWPKMPEQAERSIRKAMSFRPDLRQAEIREFSEEMYHALTGDTGRRAGRVGGTGTVEIAHVLFIDLVGYSLLPMDAQKEYLGELQEIVRGAPQFRVSEGTGDIVTLPTGDGMALAFFGDPTAPAQCALEVAGELRTRPHLKLRMGIHSGPIYRVADVNANANLSGGGINLAQRVMDCGDAGHILVSNTVADVLLQLSQWAPHLTDLGECTVKHDVKIHLYLLSTPELGNRQRPRKLVTAPRGGRSKALLVGALTAIPLLILAIAGYLYVHRPPILTERDSIVLADFANTTGDPVFDGTLRQALSLKLAESPLLDTLSDAKMDRTLRMMRHPPNERVTPQLAREICQRNALKAVVSGSISQLGNTYILQLDATNCASGDSVARTGAEARGKNAILPALSKAAVQLRSKLGETLSSIQKFDRPFEGTSSSLEALKSYSMAQKARAQGNIADELSLLQHAVELDPNFALAWAGLSTEYSNLHQAEKANAYGRKAFELRDHVTEREKFNILDKYYFNVIGDLDERIESDKLWTLAYPRDYLAFALLGSAYSKAGQNEKALEATLQAIRLNPEGPSPYVNAMGLYAALGRFDEAKRVYEDAKQHNISYRRVSVSYYDVAFLRRDAAGMAQAVQEASGKEGGQPDILVEQAMAAAYWGQLRKAQELLLRADSTHRKDDKSGISTAYARRAHMEALLGANAAAREDANSALALASERDVLALAGWSLALAGDTAHARAAEQELERRYPTNTIATRVYLPALRADLETTGAGLHKAIEGLQAAAPYELASNDWTISMYAVYSRGNAYLRDHQVLAAAAEYQKILDHPGIVMNSPIGPLAQLGLAEAYALAGDKDKSIIAFQEFFIVWKDADPDLPVLLEARKQFRRLSASGLPKS